MSVNTDRLFQCSDGTLYRVAPWRLLREDYAVHHERIDNTLALRSTLRHGPYVWPGGYPTYFLAHDMEALCFDCVRQNYVLVSTDVRARLRGSWRVVGCVVNFEEPDLCCCNCNQQIDSAYAAEDAT